MLQQTQVATVIPYYQRFMHRFPDLPALADAPIDEVLGLWSGLGYYARARNLHRAAQIAKDQHNGELPTTWEALLRLPGIGRSTAGAILALALGQRYPILDGNVKRILTRQTATRGWPGQARVEKALWQQAEARLPAARLADYTQALMDLGATICTRTRPDCPHCPVSATCQAYAQGNPGAYPQPRPRKPLPLRATRILILYNPQGEVLLERRPPAGIWGGLWSFPECPPETDATLWCRRHLGRPIEPAETWPVLRHTFSHFALDIHPVVARSPKAGNQIRESGDRAWYKMGTAGRQGIPAPTLRLLEQLRRKLKRK